MTSTNTYMGKPKKLHERLEDYFDQRLGNKIVKRMQEFEKWRWLSFHHQMNSWEFPPEFYYLMPKWMRKKNKRYAQRFMTIYSIVSDFIRQYFSNKDELRHHNVSCGKMSDGAFDYWYEYCSMVSPNEKNETVVNEFYERERVYESIEWWKDDVFEKIINLVKTDTNGNG